MICDRWDVAIVPFPFAERSDTKRRPALVLSARLFNQAGHSVLCMVTSASHTPWPGDTRLIDLSSAGLNAPCIVRLKLFTLDNRLLIRKTGTLAEADRQAFSENLRLYLL